jgi:uncharacterized protein (DUF488 family)
MTAGGSAGRRLWTVGHGTLTEAAFAALAAGADVAVVVDVRSYPGSRRNPQFGREAMAHWLAAAGIDYRWEPGLGGRRRPSPASRHTALRQDAFRAYADHMETDEFAMGLDALLDIAAAAPTALMCAEAIWWRCHRRLLADAAVLRRGAEVRHLFHDGREQPHPVTREARLEDDVVVYDAGAASLIRPR